MTRPHEKSTRVKRRFPLGLLISGALVAGLGWSVLHGDPNHSDDPLLGENASLFAAEWLDTRTLEDFPEELQLADLRGRPLAVNYWASWCIPRGEDARAPSRSRRITGWPCIPATYFIDRDGKVMS